MLSNPYHPGEYLLELMEELELSPTELARATHMPASRIRRIIKGKQRITPDTALRLAKYFNMTPDYWLGLQISHDLAQCQPDDIESIKPLEIA